MCLLFKGQFNISPGFCLLLAWFGSVNGWRLVGIILGVVMIHEAGHCAALRMMGAPIVGMRISVFGAVLEADTSGLSYGGELISVLSGPAANFLCAMLLRVLESWDTVIGANLVLCFFNLLPMRPLDGGCAVYLAVSWLAGPEAGETVTRWTGGFTAGLMATVMIFLMAFTGGSLWLLPPVIGFLAVLKREVTGKGDFL